MESFGLPALYELGRSVNTDRIGALYSCIASALGFENTIAIGTALGIGQGNDTLCPCSSMNGSECMNGSCYNPVSYH